MFCMAGYSKFAPSMKMHQIFLNIHEQPYTYRRNVYKDFYLQIQIYISLKKKTQHYKMHHMLIQKKIEC